MSRSMFSRRHYERIAKLFAENPTLKRCESIFVEMFAEDNPNFSERKFRKYIRKERKRDE